MTLEYCLPDERINLRTDHIAARLYVLRACTRPRLCSLAVAWAASWLRYLLFDTSTSAPLSSMCSGRDSLLLVTSIVTCCWHKRPAVCTRELADVLRRGRGRRRQE